jgi:hypothetical protein
LPYGVLLLAVLPSGGEEFQSVARNLFLRAREARAAMTDLKAARNSLGYN